MLRVHFISENKALIVIKNSGIILNSRKGVRNCKFYVPTEKSP